jgi:hypothetical protein
MLDGLAVDLEEDGPEIRLGIADAVGFVTAMNGRQLYGCR